MSDDRKPFWPWIVALLIGLPVLYVASFGPACWLADRGVVDFTRVIEAYPYLWRFALNVNTDPGSRIIRWNAPTGMSEDPDYIDVRLVRAQWTITQERLKRREVSVK